MTGEEKQMRYIIEGTVSEITFANKKWKFKICGAEGYSLIKKDKKETIKFNVLCQCLKNKENKCVVDNKTPSHALRIPDSFDFNISNDYDLLCASALASGKKLRFVFEETTESNSDVTTEVLKKCLKIESVSLLAN